ncbi:hypothetical protein BDR04DRAFT_1023503 [Suillus decipiens]|nr:hypothetical protein BDR04DRAFT_1023503 [Suillus decipiens]
MCTRINEFPYHPDTPAGQVAYEKQLCQWRTKWGNGARCSEHTPFPLTPGTAQICSVECFRCGGHGHISPECQNCKMSRNQEMQMMDLNRRKTAETHKGE